MGLTASLNVEEAIRRLAYVYGIAKSACEADPGLSGAQDRRQLLLIRRALADLFEPRLEIKRS